MLVPVVPEEYSIAVVSDWASLTCGNWYKWSEFSINSSMDKDDGYLFGFLDVRIVGTLVGTNLWSSSGAKIASLALESLTCLAISDLMSSGFCG